ncbi:hypothetical protein DPMN_072097 [Dreissena polymorpha]|uniref:Uncharacterized protein n=1 Tax=Dreissena polymorpha TaxID=45954 RepID=A0A9D4BWP3_DREPO|nr:hypothetical protein DPMN_072097 [Dreissena polymorpha]
MQINSHQNLHSINNYSHISEQQHKSISTILANTSNSQQMPFPYPVNQMSVTRNTMNAASHASQYTFHDGLNNMFAGSIFGGTSNINIYSAPSNQFPLPCPSSERKETLQKRRRIIVESDSD